MMKWLSVLLLMSVVAVPLFATSDDECSCKEVKVAQLGWCGPCDNGMVLGHEVTSEQVFRVLAGMEIPKNAQNKCEQCVVATKEQGVCESCHVGIAVGRVYHSLVAHTLAKGAILPHDKKTDCVSCTKNLKSGEGYCESCEGGLVAHRWFEGEKTYKQAMSANNIVVKALKVDCETCAVAMLTDGTCESCKVQFKQGKKIG